jgi:hypothetical protein
VTTERRRLYDYRQEKTDRRQAGDRQEKTDRRRLYDYRQEKTDRRQTGEDRQEKTV